MQCQHDITVIGAVFAAGLAWAAGPAAAETGRVGNLLDVPVTYSVGTPGANGVSWTEHTLGPCEMHEWTWDLDEGQTSLPMGWPLWIDARKDGYGGVIGTSGPLFLNADGSATVAFFRLGDQVWLDASGNAAAEMAKCGGAAPAPAADTAAAPEPTVIPAPAADAAPASPAPAAAPDAAAAAVPAIGEMPVEDLAASLAALVEKVARGEVLLVEVGGSFGQPGTVIAVPLEEFVALLQLDMLSGDRDISEAGALFTLAARHSKVLLVELQDEIARLGKN